MQILFSLQKFAYKESPCQNNILYFSTQDFKSSTLAQEIEGEKAMNLPRYASYLKKAFTTHYIKFEM